MKPSQDMWEEAEEEEEDRHEKGVRVAATPLRQPRRKPHRHGGLAWRGCTIPIPCKAVHGMLVRSKNVLVRSKK